MRRLIVLTSAILAALVLALTGIAVASPGVDQVPDAYKGLVEVKKDGWIIFKAKHDYTLKNPKTYVKQGERTPDGGCAFSGELVLPSGSEAVEVRETAFNPLTCQARLERGTPPPDTTASTADTTSTEDASRLRTGFKTWPTPAMGLNEL